MLKNEIKFFLFVGALTVLLDYFLYSALVELRNLPVDISRVIGFIGGSCFSFFANHYFTFSKRKLQKYSIIKFIFLYSITLGVNVMVNSWTITLMENNMYRLSIGFVFATIISTFINYLGLKFFVFR